MRFDLPRQADGASLALPWLRSQRSLISRVEVAMRAHHQIAVITVVVSQPARVFMCKLDFLLGTTGEMTSLFPAGAGLQVWLKYSCN
jgi:hypothetical protein